MSVSFSSISRPGLTLHVHRPSSDGTAARSAARSPPACSWRRRGARRAQAPAGPSAPERTAPRRRHRSRRRPRRRLRSRRRTIGYRGHAAPDHGSGVGGVGSVASPRPGPGPDPDSHRGPKWGCRDPRSTGSAAQPCEARATQCSLRNARCAAPCACVATVLRRAVHCVVHGAMHGAPHGATHQQRRAAVLEPRAVEAKRAHRLPGLAGVEFARRRPAR